YAPDLRTRSRPRLSAGAGLDIAQQVRCTSSSDASLRGDTPRLGVPRRALLRRVLDDTLDLEVVEQVRRAGEDRDRIDVIGQVLLRLVEESGTSRLVRSELRLVQAGRGLPVAAVAVVLVTAAATDAGEVASVRRAAQEGEHHD